MSPQAARKFGVVVAATRQWGIGKGGGLPWKSLKEDMKFFKNITSTVQDQEKRNAVIMGRKTWDSIPAKFRPLRNRLNVVVSRDVSNKKERGFPDDVVLVSGLDAALEYLSTAPVSDTVEQVFVIGGAMLYREALASPFCSTLYLTRVFADLDCDTFIPNFDENPEFTINPEGNSKLFVEQGMKYEFQRFERTS